MQPRRSPLHLVAQREALTSLESADSRFTDYLEFWLAGLTPVEREALRAFDHAVEVYKVSAAVNADTTQSKKPQVH